MHSIALVLIARNEATNIRRCLDSVRPWVDQMLVLDTGSGDDTASLAQSAGASVESFVWIDDFSAARNHALSLARADWRLVLDADEWLIDGGAALAALRTQKPDFVGAVRVDSDFHTAGSEASASSWISRVLPDGLRYAGRVHEQPVHALAVRRLGVHVGHAGYRPEALAAKQGRNAALLEQALRERPGDGYLLYQLGKDYAVYLQFNEAARCFEQADQALPAGQALAHDLLLRWLYALKKCGHHEQAVQLAQGRLALWQDSPDFWFTLGDLLLDWACEQPQRAEELLPMIESSWLRCLEIGERPDLEGAVQGRGSHLAATNLVVFYEGVGRTAEAALYRDLAAQGKTGAHGSSC
jgi:tetratricopeptide (TPR) repeat protein